MRVIKKSKWTKQVECTGQGNGNGGCGSLLEIEKSDIFITKNKDMTGHTEYFTTIRCIVCSVKTDVEDIPASIWRELRKNNK